jgi:hypothetical protein
MKNPSNVTCTLWELDLETASQTLRTRKGITPEYTILQTVPVSAEAPILRGQSYKQARVLQARVDTANQCC